MKAVPFSLFSAALVACAALVSCKEDAAPPAPKESPEAVAQKKELEAARSRIALMEKDLVQLTKDRTALQKSLERKALQDDVILKGRLQAASVEFAAVGGWLKASVRVLKNDQGLEATSDFEVVKQRAEDCLAEEQSIGELYDSVKKANLVPEQEMQAITIQRDFLGQARLEMEEILKSLPESP